MSDNLTIAPLQCFECSKRTEFLRISSVNVILTSIKGHNSYKFAKMTANNPNFKNLSICSQDIEQKRNFGVNQGP